MPIPVTSFEQPNSLFEGLIGAGMTHDAVFRGVLEAEVTADYGQEVGHIAFCHAKWQAEEVAGGDGGALPQPIRLELGSVDTHGLYRFPVSVTANGQLAIQVTGQPELVRAY